jgi:8-oxoguanine deaminase
MRRSSLPSTIKIENPCGGLFIRDGFIEQVCPTDELPISADVNLDLIDHIVLPGLINTYHHFYQTPTRAMPEAQDTKLFSWLKTLHPSWARMQPEDISVSTITALAELSLSDCMTASDHLNAFPNGSRLEHQIRAGLEIGMRLHASRGSMSRGESKGGLPPDSVVEVVDFIHRDSQHLIEEFHDLEPGSMTQIVLALCSPFSVTGELMNESAALAREHGVQLHTHLAETQDEEEICLEIFWHRPVADMETVDWIGSDVWFAHSIHMNDAEIDL